MHLCRSLLHRIAAKERWSKITLTWRQLWSKSVTLGQKQKPWALLGWMLCSESGILRLLD
jgi:hypothetical protein